ncbi:F0F1 ATP synthase subunit delta [Limnothrix sp. FACHB-708]|uniref:ATP synthase F1 subunit delta n=1 Tax=unclassified Limnothrix TaxID=2632864 RepID=UPI0016872071|nr:MULTISPECIES: ATP synthase F1 subunit delta [unclassified Limnothrix]MBD2553121.1 F0F1 ATP synthase subunit delta [Limnothrix sp. FACHB-708]MBD2592259.1 F0F1 ATP synthase subunit delta [Limnothrix sp. FACHB-406]
MQSSSTIASIAEPYAQALMTLAQKESLVERFGEDVTYLRGLLAASDELGALLANPFVKADDKKSVLDRLAGETLHPLTANFLKLLVDRKRIALLDSIAQKYQDLLRQFTNTALAEVTSAVELTEEQRQSAIERVKQLTGAASVELVTKVDTDLIGGVIIKVGSQVVDASLRGQLRRMALTLGAI